MSCDCKENVWKIGPYLDGELPLEEREDLEASLRECPECQKLLSAFRGLEAICARDVPPAVEAADWARVLEGARPAMSVLRAPQRRSALDGLVPLTAAAALVVAGLFLSFRGGDPAGPGTLDRASAVSPSPADDRVETLDPRRPPIIDEPIDEPTRERSAADEDEDPVDASRGR